MPLVVVAALTATTACLDPVPPAEQAEPTEVVPPGYAYPDRPPLVDHSSLGALLARLDRDHTILWVMGEIGEETGATAAILSDGRDALRAAGLSVVGLYAGPPSRWRSVVVPMLRDAGANFVCAVIEPPAAAGIAAWLAGDARTFGPGLYVVDRSQHVVARFGGDPDGVAATIARMASRGAPAPPPAPIAANTLLVRVRLVEPSTGRVIVRATAEAADPAVLVRDLAQRLTAAFQPTGIVAVAPIRRVGLAVVGAAGPDDSPGHLLAEELTRRGWRWTIFPESTTVVLATLGLTPMQVEFDPSRLAGRLSWEAILVGSIESRGQPAR